MQTSAAEFRSKWYVVERAIVGPASLRALHAHALDLAASGALAPGDPQVASAPVAYADSHFEALLERAQGEVERATGLELWPTYSYFRIYERGNLLRAHRDRPSCEISMTLNLGTSAEEPWPIWIAGPAGTAAVSLNPGDGLIYRGCDCFHWREPFVGEQQVQVFLHYVDRSGPNAQWKFDKRPRLAGA